LAVGFALGVGAIACGPQPAAPPTPVADAFAVVRATAEAAYQTGRRHLERGELEAALVELDRARTNDPDNRQEIQRALEETIARLQARTPTSAVTSATKPGAVNTVPAASGAAASTATPLAGGGTTGQATVVGTAGPTGVSAATPGPGATSVVGATSAAGGTAAPSGAGLTVWRDPQGRFTISAPVDWVRAEAPQALVGEAVVEFREPSQRASVGVAVDSSGRAVSAELYAASLELAMQQQVPGYAVEQVLPGNTSGSPSIRRQFTFTQKDGSGSEVTARGFQITVLRGSTPFIIAGSAPAADFQDFSATFDRIAETFRFS